MTQIINCGQLQRSQPCGTVPLSSRRISGAQITAVVRLKSDPKEREEGGRGRYNSKINWGTDVRSQPCGTVFPLMSADQLTTAVVKLESDPKKRE